VDNIISNAGYFEEEHMKAAHLKQLEMNQRFSLLSANDPNSGELSRGMTKGIQEEDEWRENDTLQSPTTKQIP